MEEKKFEDIWNCTATELGSKIAKHLDNYGTWDADLFLQLHFHLVKGDPTKQHIDFCDGAVEEAKAINSSLGVGLDDRAHARMILTNGSGFWDTLVSVLDRMVVGEEKNKITLSLLLSGGEHIFVMGKSSIGKSYLINNVLKTFPAEWVIKRGGLSDKVMQYIDWEGEHVNKRIFYLQEFSSVSEEQDKQLRLLSDDDGGLTFSVTVRSKETGQFTEQVGHVPPLGFITSTTKVDINDENLTRSWLVTPTDDETQTQDIINRDNTLAMFPWDRGDPTDELEMLRTCLRMLDVKSWKNKKNRFMVAQPFLPLVKFPTKVARMRRDRSKIERLASIITIINQFQRPTVRIGEQNFLIGSAGDLALAIDLTDKIFSETVTSMTERHFDVLGKIVGKYEKAIEEQEEFSGVGAREISISLPNLSQKIVYKVCESLVNMGYLIKEKGEGRGSPNLYDIKILPEAKLDVRWDGVEEQFTKWVERLPTHASSTIDGHEEVLCDCGYPESLKDNNGRQVVKAFDSVKEALENRASSSTKSKPLDSETEALEAFIQPEEIISSSPPEHEPTEADEKSYPNPFITEPPRPKVKLPKILAFIQDHMAGCGFSPAEKNYDLLYVASDKGFVEEESVGFWIVTEAGRDAVNEFIRVKSESEPNGGSEE